MKEYELIDALEAEIFKKKKLTPMIEWACLKPWYHKSLIKKIKNNPLILDRDHVSLNAKG